MSRDLQVNRFTTTAQGLVPAPGSATGKVLQDDGAWHQPSGGAGTVTSIQLTSTGGTVTITGTNPVTNSGTINLEAASSGGGSNITPDTHPSPELTVNDEFEFGSSLDLTGARFASASAWAWNRQAGSTTSVSEGSLLFTGDITGSGGLTNFFQPIAGATWAYTAKVSIVNSFATTPGAGIYVSNSANGKILLTGLSSTAGGGPASCYCNEWSGSAPGSGPAGNLSISGALGPTFETIVASVGTFGTGWVYLQVSYDGTNLRGSFSLSGVPGTFQLLWTQTPATFLGAAPTQVGLAIPTTNQVASTSVIALLCDWFRKTA